MRPACHTQNTIAASPGTPFVVPGQANFIFDRVVSVPAGKDYGKDYYSAGKEHGNDYYNN